MSALKKSSKSAAPLALPFTATTPNARKLLQKLYPAPTRGAQRASEEAADAAEAYLQARDAESAMAKAKEIAAAALCIEIRDAEGLVGDGWEASWKVAKGKVDWEKLARSMGATAEQIEAHRGPDHRTLTVRANGGEA